MSNLTASNGIKLAVLPDGEVEFIFPGSERHVSWARADEAQALREFFQHERDEELGRWRWPENPDVLAMEINGALVRFWNERTGQSAVYTMEDRKRFTPASATFDAAAAAYFAAHPEPKPWESATEGEVWIIRPANGDGEYPAIFQAGSFRDHGGYWDASEITAARRIWPETP